MAPSQSESRFSVNDRLIEMYDLNQYESTLADEQFRGLLRLEIRLFTLGTHGDQLRPRSFNAHSFFAALYFFSAVFHR